MNKIPAFSKEYAGTITDIIPLFGMKPAIFTHILFEHEDGSKDHITHAVRLHTEQSRRIGLDELRAAFPQQLAALNDEALLSTLLQKTDEFVSKTVRFVVEEQRDAKTGVVKKGPQGQPYYNVRLRSSCTQVDSATAGVLAKKLLSVITTPPRKTGSESLIEQLKHDKKPKAA